MRLKKTHEGILQKLIDLVYEEHASGCEGNTCDISTAFSQGYTVLAVELFSSSGAGSEEFYKQYKKFPQKLMRKIASLECKKLVKLPHEECPSCDAVVWCIDSDRYETIFCGNCGKFFSRSQLTLKKCVNS